MAARLRKSIVQDEWVSNNVGSAYIQTYEAAIRSHFGLPSSGMSVFERGDKRTATAKH